MIVFQGITRGDAKLEWTELQLDIGRRTRPWYPKGLDNPSTSR